LNTPSDIGFEDGAFLLPQLTITEVSVGHLDEPPADGRLFAEPAVSATAMHRTLRLSAEKRAQAAVAAVQRESDQPWLIWVNTDYDADAVSALLPDVVEIRGSDSQDVKAGGLLGFADGAFRVLMTKPSVAGYGMNFQRCARVVFVGLSFSFEQWYQAIRRTWRFGQVQPVDVVVCLSENERTILQTVKDKERAHVQLMADMITASREAVMDELRPPMAIVRTDDMPKACGDGWELVTGDCVEALAAVADASVDYAIFSPPFSNLYIYSDAQQDMGNSASDAEFFEHFRFLIEQLYRVTVPGRLCSVHCKDLPRFQNHHGAAGLYDFAGRTISVFEGAGWQFHSRVTIWKDPVIEMQRTNNHGLLYKQLRKDSCASRQGMADYLITFRKWDGLTKLADFPKPVTHTREDFPLAQWQKWASPVWDDIQQTRVLQYQQARDDEDQRHICPLQLDVIERSIQLWSNPGDLVLSPFAGIGSEGFEAVRLGRRFLGIELKESYATVAARNLRTAASMKAQGGLFSDIEMELQ
jgi:DNA modification methylase